MSRIPSLHHSSIRGDAGFRAVVPGSSTGLAGQTGGTAIYAHRRIPVVVSSIPTSTWPLTYLQEDPPINPIRLLLEDRAENHRHAIMARLDKDRLFLAILDDLQIALLFAALSAQIRLLGAGSVLEVGLEGGLFRKGSEEGGGHGG